MEFEFFSQTDTGRIRSNNEDSVAIDASCSLAVLADGMGGYAAGEVASGMACEFISAELGRWLKEAAHQASDADVRRAIDICVDNANQAIFGAAHSNPMYSGMGTTLVLGVFRSGRLLLGHIGDSRGYRFREGVLQQVTKDHSLLQEQIDAGMLTPEQAQFAAHKNLVTRALGVEEVARLELNQHDIHAGDIYLMCSDGLSDMLQDQQIAAIMAQHPTLPEMGAALIEAANEAGGRDNIAVVLVRGLGVVEAAPRSWWPFKRVNGQG